MTTSARRHRASLMFLFSLAGILAVLTLWLLRPFLEAIFLALILTFTFQPLYTAVRGKVRNDSAASLATIVLIIALVLIPLSLAALAVSREAADAIRNLNAKAAGEGGIAHYLGRITEQPLAWVGEKTGLPPDELKKQAAGRLQAMAGAMVGWAGSVASNLTSTVGTIIIALFTSFFLFAGRERIREELYSWLPMRRERVDELFRVLNDSIVANVYGMAAVGAAQGVLTAIGFVIAGLPSAAMWGMVAGILSLIPIVGSGLVWIPGALALLAQGSYGKAIFLAAWGTLLVANADNVIRPWVLSGRTNMNTLALLFALLGGMHAFGFLGLFAGPVIVSVTVAVFRILREEIAGGRDAAA